MTRTARLLLAALVLAALAPLPAQASFPGRNGPLVVSIEDCYQGGYLARIPWRGGGELEPITEVCRPGSTDEETPDGFAHPTASPDGKTLLAIRHGDGGSEFVTLGTDGSDVTSVPFPSEEFAPFPSAPTWAPDGERFAFEGDRYRGGKDRAPLWVTRTDGSERYTIDQRRGAVYENPVWSPDGRLIAVNVSAGRLRGGLWLIRARDGKPVRRLAGMRAFAPDWSPDGRQLVFHTHYAQREVEGGASGGNLYVIKRNGKQRRRLVRRENIAESQPTWSPDGRWIAWVSLDFSGGDVGFDVYPSLWRIRAGGGKLRKIADLPEPYVEEGEYVPPHLTWVSR